VSCCGIGAHGVQFSQRREFLYINRAAFSFLRRFALGFSKRRCKRTCTRVCSRSSFFFRRRNALSTGSPFLRCTSDIATFGLNPEFGRTRRERWGALKAGQSQSNYMENTPVPQLPSFQSNLTICSGQKAFRPGYKIDASIRSEQNDWAFKTILPVRIQQTINNLNIKK